MLVVLGLLFKKNKNKNFKLSINNKKKRRVHDNLRLCATEQTTLLFQKLAERNGTSSIV